MMIVFGLLAVIQIAAFRGGLGAHRSAQFLPFWIGLVALAIELLAWWNRTRRAMDRPNRLLRLLVPTWAAMTLAVVGVFAALATDFDDYIHFMNGRTPASAACLRSYKTAPTYCRDHLFLGPMHSLYHFHHVGRLVDEGKLLVFGRRRRWTMQGDTILGTVSATSSNPWHCPVWIRGKRSGDRQPWSSYRRLNLLLESPNTAQWSFSLPENLRRAVFRSAVAMANDAPRTDSADGATVNVFVRAAGSGDERVFSAFLAPGDQDWKAIVFPLDEHAGKTVTIRLTSTMGHNPDADWLIFRYPRIELDVDVSKYTYTRTRPAPKNTRRSSDFPAPGEGALCFDLSDTTRWRTKGLVALDPASHGLPTWTLTEAFPSFTSTEDLDVDLGDFSHLVIRQRGTGGDGADYDLSFRFATGESRHLSLALFNNDRMQSYSHDLRLLEAPGPLLEGLEVVVNSSGWRVSEGTVTIPKMCLVRRSGASHAVFSDGFESNGLHSGWER
jgi:hypothetical protein